MDLELEEMAMRYDATGDTSHLSAVGHVGGGRMYAEGCLDMREICVGIDRTRRALIAADAWGHSMANALLWTGVHNKRGGVRLKLKNIPYDEIIYKKKYNALYQAAQINVSNEPCLDDMEGLEAPGDLG